MKIPRYQSRGSISTQAPGRSMTARMRAEPYVQQALAKGNVFGEAVSQVGQFAQMRYKMAREAQLSNALLGTQEQLAEEYNRLSKSEKPWGVLDGDDPEWNKTTEGIRTKMRDSVGTDRSALQRFDETFSRQELQQRFRLRTAIDQKIEADTQATHRQYLQDKEDQAVAAETVQYLDLQFKEAGAESNKLSTVLDFNPVALKEQEYALLNNVAYRRLQKLVDESGKPLTKFSAIHKALRDDDLQELIDAGGDGLIEVELLKRLRPEDRAKILNSVGSTRQAIDGKTIEEENLLKTQEVFAKSAADDIEEATKATTDGFDVKLSDFNSIEEKVKQAIQILPPDEAKEITAGYENLVAITAARNEVRQMNPDQITKYINDLRAEGTETERQRNVISFLEDYQTKFQKRIDDTPYQVAQQNGLLAGKFKRINFDFSSEQSVKNVMDGLKLRNSLYREVDALYNRTKRGLQPKILDDGEVIQFSNILDSMDFPTKFNAIMSVQQALGNDAQHLFTQVSDDAPLLSHLAGLMSDGLVPEAEIIFKGLEEIEANGSPIQGADMAFAEDELFSIIGSAYEMLPGKLNAQLKKNVKTVAQAYYAEFISRTGDRTYQPDLWQKAVNIAVGANIKSGDNVADIGIVNLRGSGNVGTTILPVNINKETVLSALENISLDNFSSITQNSRVSDETRLIDEELFNAIKDDESYTFTAIGRENGRILYTITRGEYGATDFGIMTDTDNIDIQFTIEDLIEAEKEQKQKQELSEELGVVGFTEKGVVEETEKFVNQKDIKVTNDNDTSQVVKSTKKLNGNFLLSNYELAQLPSYDKKSYEKKEARYTTQVLKELQNDFSIKNIVNVLTDYDIRDWAKENDIIVNDIIVNNLKTIAKIEYESKKDG
tara:strand:+ start:1609 stop:4278 length:2670 start_codon:yes stop_codon:yes gene_type:complete